MKDLGFPSIPSGKESACQCSRHKRPTFNSCIWKIPWSRKWQLIPAFLPGKHHGQRSPAGYSARGQRVWHDLATKHMHSQDFIQTDTHRWLNVSMITIMDFWFYAMPTWIMNIYVYISCGILCIYIYRDPVYIFTEYI